MTKNTAILAEFDPAEYLDNPESIQAYINEAVATGDAAFISESLGVVARAKGMTDLATQTGLSRETLYRTLSQKGNPNLKTLLAIVSALGLTFNFKVEKHA
ncbi:putative addiction module antidote protein [Vibrio parahaemolyticus]|uniref:addiction module antidote protein n=1 Tax=Vibrio parahaemolyticus TaxID=670 RepID=UPI00047191A2|nr:addiction module antidote protein [Vibrio parahaemolyticus]EHC7291008.1 putative addiction module antidote protein [Vibrio parahaemolyticus]EHK7406873.1 putative addiction module antidote protein [Vibrio parahaemolyticus]EJE4149837.1 putative addiction module antidote protein [Vibrio parahaemolyticus]MDF4269747.1 putative addiction module antidote protein [Vibrio parahaemolyticus]MDF4275083.1 putative addiction module antidote protein [Vibrio parahaemolyticus]